MENNEAVSQETSTIQNRPVALYMGAAVYMLCLLSSVVIFAGNKLCSLGKRGDMKPMMKAWHVVWWTVVTSLGTMIIVTATASLLFKLAMYVIPHDDQAATDTFNLVVKHSWASIGGMLLCSSLVNIVAMVVMVLPGHKVPFEAIDIIFVVAAVQAVALFTWMTKMSNVVT